MTGARATSSRNRGRSNSAPKSSGPTTVTAVENDNIGPNIEKFSNKFLDYREECNARKVNIKSSEPYVTVGTTTWSKNSFGLFNYHTADLMVNKQFQVAGKDTKILRHE